MSATTSRRHGPPDTAPRVRAGAHRGGGGVLAALVPSALAVAAVASLITALAVWQGEERDPPSAAAPVTSTTPSSSPTVAAAEPSVAASTTPAASPSTEVADTKAVTSGLEVVVLNQTSRGGLAGTVADRLRASGWEVPAVGNFRGILRATTVYYPVGARADALAVAGDLPTEPRVRPRFGNLSETRLTVVVTDSYPG
ncbi:MAG: LytR C-terminal domain-containing protein [Actinomycetes bacterium]